MRPVGVILAGGRSSRMGGDDKALRMLDGASMLDHVLAVVAPHLDGVLVNSNSDAGLFRQHNLPVLPDCLTGQLGPLAGLLTGMRWARQAHPRATHIVTVPCDTPLLPTDLVPKLTAALTGSGAQIAIASDNERHHPTLGLWPVSLADRLADDLMLGIRAMRIWLAQFTVTTVPFDAKRLININTPADLIAASRLVANIRTSHIAQPLFQKIY